MWLCYLDESGNTGRRLDDPDQPVHLIAAVLVPEDRVFDMCTRLDSLLASLPITASRLELHGSQMYSGKGAWHGIEPELRVEIYRSALEVLEQVDAVVAHASISKKRLASKYQDPESPHLLALQFLTEKIEIFLRAQTDPLRMRALLVADETHEHEVFALDLVAKMQREAGPYGGGPVLTSIVDTVHFVRSETNLGVQLADLVAYIIGRSQRIVADSELRQDPVILEFERLIRNRVRTWRSTWP